MAMVAAAKFTYLEPLLNIQQEICYHTLTWADLSAERAADRLKMAAPTTPLMSPRGVRARRPPRSGGAASCRSLGGWEGQRAGSGLSGSTPTTRKSCRRSCGPVRNAELRASPLPTESAF